MQRRTGFYLVALSLVVGLLLLWWQRGGKSSGTNVRDANQPAASSGQRGTIAVDPSGRLGTSADHRANEATLAYDPVDSRGSLRLEGRVITADGQPVAKMEVSLSSRTVRTALTEDDGSFYFEALLPQLYRVYARGEAGLAGPGTVLLSPTSDPLTLVLYDGAHLRFIVTSQATGRPVVGAKVEVRAMELARLGEGALAVRAQTDARGIAELRPAPADFVEFRVTAPGYREPLLMGRNVPPGFVQEVKIELEPGAPIFGVVRQANGAPAPAACIAAFIDLPCQAITDARGAFSLASPPATRAWDASGSLPTITARHPELGVGTLASSTLVAPQGDGTSSSPYVIVLKPLRSVRGRVVDAHAAAVAGAVVQASQRLDMLARIKGPDGVTPLPTERLAQLTSNATHAYLPVPGVAVTNAQGEFTLQLPPFDAMAVVAFTASQTSHVILLTEATTSPLVLSLDTDGGGSLRGRVLTATGEPAEGIEVSTRPMDKRESMHPVVTVRGPLVAVTNAEGDFVITGAPRGSYIIYASLPQLTKIRSARASAEATTNGAPVRLTLPALGSLVITATDAQGTPIANFGVQSPKAAANDRALPDIMSWTVNPNGQLLVIGIPLGTHQLVAMAKGYRDQPFSITLARDGERVEAAVTLSVVTP